MRRFSFANNYSVKCVLVLLLIGLVTLLVNIYELRRVQAVHYITEHKQLPKSVPDEVRQQITPGKLVFLRDSRYRMPIKHPEEIVLRRLGYDVTYNVNDDWSFMYVWDYPFYVDHPIPWIFKPYQKVNHFPGTRSFTSKSELTKMNLKSIPKGFKLPEQRADFLNEIQNDPESMWLQKSLGHRGVTMRSVEEILLQKFKKNKSSYVQKYVNNPLLVAGRKVDIGIFSVLTSVNPLRVYVWDRDALTRYGIKPYHPFNPEDVDQVVVGGNSAFHNVTKISEMPVIKDYFTKLGLNQKDTFTYYLRQKGFPNEEIFASMYATLREIFTMKEPEILEATMKVQKSSRRNLFELTRTDFLIDTDFKVHLVEINTSPNMEPTAHPERVSFNDQVLCDTFSLVGVAYAQTKDFVRSKDEEREMDVADNDLVVFPQFCYNNCLPCRSMKVLFQGCGLCLHCLTDDQKYELKTAYIEHTNRRGMRRIIPKPTTPEEANESQSPMFSSVNEWMSEWFRGKCINDHAWCQ